MTAPSQPPDPRVQRIADALDVWSDTVGYESHRRLARVLVEELGGRDANVAATEIDPRIVGWMDVCKTLDDVDPTWSTRYNSTDAAILAIRQLAAQQRENAETVNALKERVETAEAANTELDNARNSAEQSARDLRENNATLRAELDAIKGAQVPFAYGGNNADGFPVISLSAQAGLPPLYRHPAPALPVVGACVVRDGKLITWTSESDFPQERREVHARNYAHWHGGEPHYLHLGAPLPTEGGK